MIEKLFEGAGRKDDDSDAARERRKGCTICGLEKPLHFFKAHPYSPQRVRATYQLDSLGINTSTVAAFSETIIDRIQAEGREMFKRGVFFEDYYGVRGKVRVGLHDEDYSKDIDIGEVRASHHPPGRAVVEMFAGRGLVGDDPDPMKRIYIAQNEDWPSVFAHVVALSAHARKRSPELRVGQRIIVERSMSDKIHLTTPIGGYTALFHVIHVDDIYAIA